MDGEKRRQIILTQLKKATKPISASHFAKEFHVSRQIIVGDIALLRASGEEITATARGYLFQLPEHQGYEGKIAVQHEADRTEEELLLILSAGGEVLDVLVEHPIYGELRGNLHLRTKKDVALFMKNYHASQAVLLSQLTEGVHLHTIRCADEQTFFLIKERLGSAGILYKG